MTSLPYSRQTIDEDDIAAIVEVLRGDWLTTGPKIDAFEAALAAETGAAHAVAVANGTAALHLAAIALGFEGRAVIVPAVTFLATANAVRLAGGEVVFADVDTDSGLLTPATLEQAIARAKAAGLELGGVCPVHLAGHMCDMPALAQICDAAGIPIVEDAAHAVGGGYRDSGDETIPVGSCRHGVAATLSFHPVKPITTAEGGAITTNDAALAQRLRRLRNHGMEVRPDTPEDATRGLDSSGAPNPWFYQMREIGLNYRLSDVHAALGISQLRKLEQFRALRAARAANYDELLAPLAPLVQPVPHRREMRSAWHLYIALIDFASAGLERSTIMRRLAENGVSTQVHYIPVHLQPYYRQRYGDIALPGAEAFYRRCLSLPLFATMQPEDCSAVVTALKESLGRG